MGLFVDERWELPDVESLCHPDSSVIVACFDDVSVFDQVLSGEVSLVVLIDMVLDGSLLQVHSEPPWESGGGRANVFVGVEASATGLGAVIPIHDVGAL